MGKIKKAATSNYYFETWPNIWGDQPMNQTTVPAKTKSTAKGITVAVKKNTICNSAQKGRHSIHTLGQTLGTCRKGQGNTYLSREKTCGQIKQIVTKKKGESESESLS